MHLVGAYRKLSINTSKVFLFRTHIEVDALVVSCFMISVLKIELNRYNKFESGRNFIELHLSKPATMNAKSLRDDCRISRLQNAHGLEYVQGVCFAIYFGILFLS